MSTHQQIIERAESLFFRFGVKSVTMDDVANELGISKKTLYQVVPTKADLIDQIVDNHIRAEVAMIEDQRAQAVNAIDEMLAVSRMVGDTLRRMTPLLLFDRVSSTSATASCTRILAASGSSPRSLSSERYHAAKLFQESERPV